MKEGSTTELEVKFYVDDLQAIEHRLLEVGGMPGSPRVHEINLRFDTQDGELSRSLRVLRLRQDRIARITYKGPGVEQGGARLREELEFEVSDFATARALFESLGYQVILFYEKYRTTYHLGEVEVVLDEMPYGNFVEIEGPDGKRIQETALSLGLRWEKRILESYTVLFERVKRALGLNFRDLNFDNFIGVPVDEVALGIE